MVFKRRNSVKRIKIEEKFKNNQNKSAKEETIRDRVKVTVQKLEKSDVSKEIPSRNEGISIGDE